MGWKEKNSPPTAVAYTSPLPSALDTLTLPAQLHASAVSISSVSMSSAASCSFLAISSRNAPIWLSVTVSSTGMKQLIWAYSISLTPCQRSASSWLGSRRERRCMPRKHPSAASSSTRHTAKNINFFTPSFRANSFIRIFQGQFSASARRTMSPLATGAEDVVIT